MKTLNYLLKGFGFENINDFSTTVFKIFYIQKSTLFLSVSGILATIRMHFEHLIGLDVLVYISFVILIVAETRSGIKVAITKKGERVQSRKLGRMFLKIGVYTQILFVLYSFASRIKNPSVFGFEVNPFEWLYYAFFSGIIFQLVLSYLENLSSLGYSEAKGVLGIILRKYNKWFEFDGSKNADKNEQ